MDNYPSAYDPEMKDDVCDDPQGFLDDYHAKKRIKKSVVGCVAFLFGRLENGESIAVCHEGVRPRLYISTTALRTSVAELRASMEAELDGVPGRGDDELDFCLKRFVHAYGFEEGITHEYIEISFPNLTTFRHIKRLKQEIESDKVTKRIASTRAALDEMKAFLTFSSVQFMRASLTKTERRIMQVECKIVEVRVEEIEKLLLPSLLQKQDINGTGENRYQQQNPSKRLCTTASRPVFWEAALVQEDMVDPLTRYFQEEDLYPGRWYTISDQACDTEYRCTTTDVEVRLTTVGGFRPIEVNSVSSFLVCYYDLETLGLDPSQHQIIQISLVFERGLTIESKHIVSLGGLECGSSLGDIIPHVCNDELELIACMSRLVRQKDPDFLVSYNGVNFDNRFLDTRSSLLCQRNNSKGPSGCGTIFLSRFALKASRLTELRLSSSGMGDNVLRFFDTPGRSNLDWYVKLKSDLPSEASYKLNHFARTICGDKKDDLDYREIPVLQRGTNSDRSRLARYCVQDSVLLSTLNLARNMVIDIIQFAAVFGITCEWVYFRGQQVRFVSQLLRLCRCASSTIPILLNIPLQGFTGSDFIGKYQGATVNEPIAGFYKSPVLVCDWASLYPSIMRTHNLCHSTCINTRDIPGFLKRGWKIVDSSSHERVDSKCIVRHTVGDDTFTYFVPKIVKRGILPELLECLGNDRKDAKARARECVETLRTTIDGNERKELKIQEGIYNGKQIAIKVAMNSIYGACGAVVTGKYPHLDISCTVTAEGRRAMDIKKEILPKRFPGVKIIYGGSSFPLYPDDLLTTNYRPPSPFTTALPLLFHSLAPLLLCSSLLCILSC